MSKNRDHIEEEARAHITLGILLQRKRDTTHKNEVERIVHGHEPILVKIDKIRSLDAQYFGTSREAENDLSIYSNDSKKGKRDDAFRRTAGKNRSVRPSRNINAKTILFKASLFKFLFIDFRLIKTFAQQSMTLECRAFPPKIRLHANLGQYLARVQQKAAKELWLFLNRVENQGWLYLFKRDYNLIMILRDLCSEVMTTSFAFRKSDQSNVVDRYIRLENAFLLLHSGPDYGDRILSQIDYLLHEVPEFSECEDKHLQTIRLMLSEENSIPSLRDFIRAINIIKYKTFFKLEHLIRNDLDPVIDGETFHCSPSTQEKINIHIRNLKKSLEDDQKRLKEMMRLTVFLEDQDISDKFLPLKDFYLKTVADGNYEDDFPKPLVLCPKMFTAIEKTFEELMNGKIQTERQGYITLFDGKTNRIEFDMMHTLRRNMRDYAKKIAIFNRERYLFLKSTPQNAIEAEFVVLRDFEKAAKAVRDLMSRMIDFLNPGKKTLAPKTKDEDIDENDMIVSEHLSGLSVIEALYYFIRVAFSFLYYFSDNETLALLSEEGKIKHEVERKLETLKRISDMTTYREMKDRFIEIELLDSSY